MLDLALRPYELSDAYAFHEAAVESQPDLHPWMPWCHPEYSLQEAADWVTMQVAAFEEKTAFEFFIVDAAGRPLGGCGLSQIDARNRRANLGYWIRSSATGHNRAAEAVRLLVRWGRENTDLERIEVVVATGNQRSLRVAEKAGAVQEGILRNRLYLNGVFHDAVMFAFVTG